MITFFQFLEQFIILDEALPGYVTLFHGTTVNHANNILENGILDRTAFDPATNMAGEFWCTKDLEYAKLMAQMTQYHSENDKPAVLQFELPKDILKRLDRSDYDKHDNAFEFRSGSFDTLNDAIRSKIVIEFEPTQTPSNNPSTKTQ